MNVKLVSITKSLVEEKELSPEELIVYIARVSNPSNQLNSETADKLIAFLIRNKHWSPFEMVDMTVEIVTSRGIAQQILRHRSFSFHGTPASTVISQHLEKCEILYKELLELGVAKECARFVLPITTQTKIYMKGSIRSWIHYLQIRCDKHTQLEHREIALAILELFQPHFPNIYKASTGWN